MPLGAGPLPALPRVRLRLTDRAPAPDGTGVFSVSVDGELAATGCGDRIVRLWSLSSFACVRSLEHHASGFTNYPVFSVKLSGGVLVSGSEDKSVRVWTLAGGGECVATLTHGATVKGVAISKKGGFVASTGPKSGLVVWRPTGSDKASGGGGGGWFSNVFAIS